MPREHEKTTIKKSWLRRQFLEPLISSANPPWFDARGIAAGLFIGMGVPLGLHMITMALLRLILKYNVVVAFAFTFVNNPITLIPMYYAFYALGSILLGKPTPLTMTDFQHLMDPIIHADNFMLAVHNFLSLGMDILVRWTIGAIIIAGIFSLLGYLVGYWLLRKRCIRKARSIGLTYQEMVNRLEKTMQGSE